MAISLEQFVRQLTDCGILRSETLNAFLPPAAFPKDAEDLARSLVREKKLTKFQVEEISRGRGKSLTLGNYVLLQKIGEGGMGQVYKARHVRMDRMVAIKVLSTALSKDETAIARFEREVKAAARLSHPNIVAAHDADCANGVHFLAMEFVEGRDLSAIVKNDGALPVTRAVNYILQASRGLAAAHEAGIVHRDIKPSNLLLDKNDTVKILDMGLARLQDDVGNQAELTATGTVMGTVDYMAPEQAMSTKSADARSDIYSLGCTMYYLISGKATFDGETILARMLAHRDHPIPSLTTISQSVSSNLDAIFRKMLAKNQEDRYQSMRQVIEALENLDADSATRFDIRAVADNTPVSASDTMIEPGLFSRTEMDSPLRESNMTSAVTQATILDSTTVDQSLKTRSPNRKLPILVASGIAGALLLALAIAFYMPRHSNNNGVVDTTNVTSNSGKGIEESDKSEVSRKPLAFELPEFAKWSQRVESLPPEELIEAVRRKLVELNPEFNGALDEVNHQFQTGLIYRIVLSVDNVTDISPLRALKALSALVLMGTNKSKFKDLSPLQGMSLESLDILDTQQLSDLRPLKNMPLASLWTRGTSITDLSSLAGMKLRRCGIEASNVSDLAVLKGMPLEEFHCGMTKVEDLTPLHGLPLRKLLCGYSSIADISPLKGCPLEYVHFEATKIVDLSGLVGAPLTSITLTGTQVSDLDSLRGMPLKDLNLRYAPVSSLESIKELPLEALRIAGTKVDDLMPIAGLKLKYIDIIPTRITRGMEGLRAMESLQTICVLQDGEKEFTAAEFWKKYDAGEFSKP